MHLLCYSWRATAPSLLKSKLTIHKQSIDKNPWCVTIQMKAIEQYFHVVLFIMLYKLVLTFESADETLVCDHSNESY